MRRTQLRWRAAPALLVVVSVCRVGMAAPAAAQSQAVAVSVAPPVAPKVFKGDVRHLPAIPPKPLEGLQRSRPVFRKSGGPGPRLPEALAAVAAMPAPIQTFAGLSLRGSCGTSQCGAGFPPDPVGDVGPNHYVQGVNTAVGIYSKTGTQLAAFTFDALWAGANTGTACDANNAGDPTVIYDPLADRWFVADLGFTDFSTPPFYECIAVSMSGDPVSGGWYLYAIRADDAAHAYFPDYPKMGIWPDGLYMTANEFEGNTYREVRIWAFDRVGMEAGQPVQSVIVDTNDASLFSMLPANWRGTPPPPGTPNYLVVQDPTLFRYDVYKFHVDWATPANSTFTGPTRVTQGTYGPPYTTSFSTDIVPQSGTSTKLDSLGDQLMMQAQYRNIGGVESLWVVHTVRPSGTTTGPTGVQWAQLDVTGSTIAASPVQEQIFTNGDDGLYRWIPSIAVDGSGNAALGYSASNATSFPSIRYAGRLVTDPLGTMGQGETTLFAGTGSQKFTCGGPCSRWGDYSAMTVDPVDDCTFWYVNEYYVTTGSSDWQTRIGSFRFPSCVCLTPTPAPTATPTRTPTFTPTATATPTVTPTPTASPTQSSTPTATPTPTRTPTPTATASATATATNTATPAWTATATATATNTATITPTATATGTATSTGTATPTATATNTPTPTATATSGPTCSLCGDANGDGSVDIVDALFIAQLTVDRRPTLACPNRADVNGDAAVTIVDALFISQYIVDLRSALDCGGPG